MPFNRIIRTSIKTLVYQVKPDFLISPLLYFYILCIVSIKQLYTYHNFSKGGVFMSINFNKFVPRPGLVNKQGHLPDPSELVCIEVPKIFDQCLMTQIQQIVN